MLLCNLATTDTSGKMAQSENCLVDEQFMIFAGSSEEDIAFANLFWKSVTLHPPIESRLVSSNIQQRLKVALPLAQLRNPQLNVAHQVPEEDFKSELLLLEAREKQEDAEKAQYLLKARRREDIIALLRKQRAERIKKEKISLLYKPKITAQRRSDDELRAAKAEAEAEADAVRQLE
ncbi:cilia- and flagella-associated protein HOATZ [Microcaecilia unicolor]|uniref:Cilia- and flagella-associated protein HOATZ n=1 Tax=Microcaecilia unicolor TaxID=1415580 RepID=A0A6P7ZB92_9AMPH|nr:UPF0722 protein C11orf88 homolog [Microcaecilia unicolor]